MAFSETDFTEDLKQIDVPMLVMHGDDDQIVPYRRLRPAVGQAAQERDAEDLPRLPARHAHHARRRHQRRPAGLATAVASTTARSAENNALIPNGPWRYGPHPAGLH